MRRQNIKVEVLYSFDWAGGVPLEQIKQDIEALEKLGVSEINIEIGGYYDNSIVHTAYRNRVETSEEAKQRLKEVNDRKEAQKAYELNLLNKLKKLYE